MASTIKSIPVLEGQSAENFVRRADRFSSVPTPTLSENEAEQLSMFLEKSKLFKF